MFIFYDFCGFIISITAFIKYIQFSFLYLQYQLNNIDTVLFFSPNKYSQIINSADFLLNLVLHLFFISNILNTQ